MKYIILILFFVVSIFACTGDCMSCHPKLVPTIDKDLRHKPMLTCINCHLADPNKMADCGADCFGCHPMSKIYKAKVKEHEIIQECRDCHVGAKEKLFDVATSFDQSSKDTLKDYIIR